MIYLPEPEPKLSEICVVAAPTDDPEWPEVHPGELIYRINCQDGVVLIYYVPEEK